MRVLLVALLLAGSAFVAIPAASAAPPLGGGCTDLVNDANTCSGTCVWPTPTAPTLCVNSFEQVCTAGHATCTGWDVVCAYGKVDQCLTVYCACYPAADVAPPVSPSCTGCLPWVCVEDVNAQTCWGEDGEHDVCIGFSLEIPYCTDLPGIELNCAVLRPACEPTDPCAWGYVECVPPCACMPADVRFATPML